MNCPLCSADLYDFIDEGLICPECGWTQDRYPPLIGHETWEDLKMTRDTPNEFKGSGGLEP